MNKTVFSCFFILWSCISVAQISKDSAFLFATQGALSDNFEKNYLLSQKVLAYFIQRSDTVHVIESFQKTGDMLWFKGLYGQAEEYYFKSLQFADSTQTPNLYAYALYSIGWIECVQKGKQDKMDMLKRALRICLKTNNANYLVNIYNSLGGAYGNFYQKDTTKTNYVDSAIVFLRAAFQINKKNELRYLNPQIKINLANEFSRKKEYDSALYYVNEVLAESKQNNEKLFLSATTLKSNIFLSVGKTDSALYLALNNLKKIQNSDNKEMMENLYLALYLGYKIKKNPTEALKYLEKLNTLQKKITQELMSTQYEDLNASYQILKKGQKISELTKQNELYEVKEKQKTLVLVGALILILFGTVFIFFTVKQNRRIKKLHADVSTQKHLVEEKNKEITDSITYAKRIQNAILPNPKKWQTLLPHSFVLYQPKDIVAGDFYWLEETAQYLYIAAADCTGHGVPGAMVSVVCSSALSKAVLEEKQTETHAILDATRRLVLEQLGKSEEKIRDGMDICLIRINKNNRKHIQYSGANRPLYISNAQGELQELKPDKQPIGEYENEKPFSQQELVLNENDTLYLLTDGYADQFGGDNNKKFSSKALKKLMTENAHKTIEEQNRIFTQAFFSWRNNIEQTDDVTLLGIKI
ncbi:MAG: serine/threonine-protein phosphatase [Bacteroidetes bacterium]|nr:serine/threonine-protein phosphatase [Bacteroidota bacterium]